MRDSSLFDKDYETFFSSFFPKAQNSTQMKSCALSLPLQWTDVPTYVEQMSRGRFAPRNQTYPLGEMKFACPVEAKDGVEVPGRPERNFSQITTR